MAGTPDVGYVEKVMQNVRDVAVALVEAMAIPVMLLDDDLVVVAANSALRDRFAMGAAQIHGQHLTEMQEGAWRIPGLLDRLRDMPPDHNVFQGFEVEHDSPALGKRWLFVNARQICLGDVNANLILLTIEDMTKACLNGAELTSHRERAASLTADLASAEDKQHRKLAVHLHDGVVQTLVLARREVSKLCEQAGQAAAAQSAARCAEIIDEAIDQIRDVTYELSPPILYDLGLLPALKWLADHLEQKFGLAVQVIDDGSVIRLSRSAEATVFRSVRELLVNAAKHAAGGEVIVTAAGDDRTARFVVRDQGPGFDASKISVRQDGSLSFGLASVKEQISSAGGNIEIHSVLGEGTRVTLTVPVRRRRRKPVGDAR